MEEAKQLPLLLKLIEGGVMNIKTIGVVGAGQMGSGITQVFASAGFNVIMLDVKEEFCERGLKTIKASLDKMMSK